jgi:hypothetical protein
MPYVPGFDYDLFLSYASADNREGAVEEFAAVMEKHISDNLVNSFSREEKIRIYFDRERLASQTAVNWEDHLQRAASSTAILVPLLSPNYLSSRYCDKERDWFAAQPHAKIGCPFAVVGWSPVAQNPVPPEFKQAQRHPAGDTWAALLPQPERIESVREFALKLRDALVAMRSSMSAVFFGPAAGRGIATRDRLRDELEKSGYRVTPDKDFEYRDNQGIQDGLRTALLAIHFPGDGLDLEGLAAIEESFRSAAKTLLVQPFGATLSEEEEGVLADINAELGSGGRFARVAHASLRDKTDDQVWEFVKRDVRAARFRKSRSEYAVGIACEPRDLEGAKALAGLIVQAGVRAQYPPFDVSKSYLEKIQALSDTITGSKALLCYWAKADGTNLERRLERDAGRRFQAKGWYLAPPLDVPGKERLKQTSEMVLLQQAEEADLATLEPFLAELGWEREPEK